MGDLQAALSPYRSEGIPYFFLTEIIYPKDPRAESPEMKAARLKEVRNLIKRGTFKSFSARTFLQMQMCCHGDSSWKSSRLKTERSISKKNTSSEATETK